MCDDVRRGKEMSSGIFYINTSRATSADSDDLTIPSGNFGGYWNNAEMISAYH